MALSTARVRFGTSITVLMLFVLSTYPLSSFASNNDALNINDKAKVQVLKGYRLKYSVETSASQSTIWRLWSDVKHWNKFDTLLEYSYLDEKSQKLERQCLPTKWFLEGVYVF